jgi:hypothetical protein
VAVVPLLNLPLKNPLPQSLPNLLNPPPKNRLKNLVNLVKLKALLPPRKVVEYWKQ